MGALSNDGRDDTPSQPRVGPKIELIYERWHYKMPKTPSTWSRMPDYERAEWEKARELVEQHRLLTHEMRCLGLLKVEDAYWSNLW